MALFPVTHSILSQRALAAEVLPHYFGGSPSECRLLVRGMNDTYLVHSEGTRYILRAYRHGHRSLQDIRHELDLLQYLHSRSIGVAAPLTRLDGQYATEIQAPEGTRYAALFAYAPGHMLPLSPETAGRYGQAAARLHAIMNTFVSKHRRYQIDLKHLLDDRVPWILPLLEHRPEDQLFVNRVWRFLREHLDSIAPHLRWGMCHGDLNGGNCHTDNEGNLTFFDFDCEGPGWPAYDAAVFNWSVRDMSDRHYARQLWQAYLDAYQHVLPLSEMELASIPYFVAARQLWLVGLHCQHADEWSYGNLSEAYFDRRLRILHELVHEHDWKL
ncbi:phosphotransferase enzyme family protein [Paenibacillus spongiae]|uniref:Phosphotransferase n=1 Tax=Paenibacillus spongiae TaxID=2909671 RepID=A0ABY5SHL3_9BACL|nr:phosphotransferase [Paenibacillus spongiae]UVI33149.1 phosphotransferase [Paenibacillus spongiae]